ncbi:hypothetical protein ACW5EG_14520 [Luteimonas sp. A611]
MSTNLGFFSDLQILSRFCTVDNIIYMLISQILVMTALPLNEMFWRVRTTNVCVTCLRVDSTINDARGRAVDCIGLKPQPLRRSRITV